MAVRRAYKYRGDIFIHTPDEGDELPLRTNFADLLEPIEIQPRCRAPDDSTGRVSTCAFTGRAVLALIFSSPFQLPMKRVDRQRVGQARGFCSIRIMPEPQSPAAFTIAAIMVSKVGYRVDVPWWILINGAVVLPISFFCLATGPKYISGPEVAMFYLLEAVLAPIWVWMIFAEVPTSASLTGGAILIVTLIAHSLWLLKGSRRESVAAHVA